MKPLRVILKEISREATANYVRMAYADHNSRPVAPEDHVYQLHGDSWIKNDARQRKYINRTKGIHLATHKLTKEK